MINTKKFELHSLFILQRNIENGTNNKQIRRLLMTSQDRWTCAHIKPTINTSTHLTSQRIKSSINWCE